MSTLVPRVSYGPSSAADPAEGRRFGRAFWASAILHSLAVALLVVVTLVVRDRAEDPPAVFEVVAGEGSNFMADEAPEGSEDGRATEIAALEIPEMQSAPTWTPPVQVVPVQPVTPPPAEVAEPITAPNFASSMKATIRQEQRKTQREIRQQRAAEAAAERAAEKAAAEKAAAEAKRRATTSYEQFRKEQGVKSSPKTSSTAKADPGKRIDANSIKRGVTGGAGAQAEGAGGRALSAAQAAEMDRYFAMLKQRLRDAHVLPPGVSDLLSAEVVYTVAANGVISGVRIERSSGNSEFDRSVLEAFARVNMPPRPDKLTTERVIRFVIKSE